MQKNKYVYILISNNNDLYYQQALISIYSLRTHTPNAHITVLCDNDTANSFKDDRDEIKKYITELKIIQIPKNFNTAKQKSRWLKTSIREHIVGDILFIDCDTIITENIDTIFNLNIDLGAVYDLHTTLDTYPLGNTIFERAKMLGYSLENESEYFNSGVLLIKDNERTYSFFKKWHNNWIDSCKQGLDFDQPTFAKTNIEAGHLIKPLDDTYNCQLKYGAKALGNAKIIHYFNFSQPNEPYAFMNNSLLEEMKGKSLKDCIIFKYIQDPKSAFLEPTMIVGMKDLQFIYSPIYILFKQNVFNSKFSYYFLLTACRIINKINKMLRRKILNKQQKQQ